MVNQVNQTNNLTVEQAQFQEWLSHPVTSQLRQWAQNRRQELMDQWANGDFFASFNTEMIAKNAGAASACSIYQQINELDFEVIYEK